MITALLLALRRSGAEKGGCKVSTGTTVLQRKCPHNERRNARAAHQQRTAPEAPYVEANQLNLFEEV